MDESSPNLASQRVERAKRRFDESWLNRHNDPYTVERDLDDLDVAVGLWIGALESNAPAAGTRES